MVVKENNYVDITQKSVVSCVEWFYGYGGNALGLRRAIPGLRAVAVCERDAFVVANMVSKMEKGLLDAVPIWTDVTDFPTEPFGRGVLDLFVASYPCQGFSHAGKRLGADDHRHLWPYCRKFIGAVRPRFVWLENVEGHVSLGLSTVLSDLEEDGYTAAWGIFSAAEVGAPHQRKRVFILAYDKGMQCDGGNDNTGLMSRPQEIPELGNCGGEDELALRNGSASGGEDVALLLIPRLEGHAGDVNGAGRESGGAAGSAPEGGVQRETVPGIYEGENGSDPEGGPVTARNGQRVLDQDGGRGVWPSRPGEQQHGWEPPRVVGYTRQQPERMSGKPERASNNSSGPNNEEYSCQTQPPMGGNADGPAAGLDFPRCTGLSDIELAEIREWRVKGTNRTDELRMCGNGVVPATAERAFRVLYAELTK